MNEKVLLKRLDIDPDILPKDYDAWTGDLWSYVNDLESIDYGISYADENYDPDTGVGKERYDEALKVYNREIDELRANVLLALTGRVE